MPSSIPVNARVITALHLPSGDGTLPNDGAMLVEVEVSRLGATQAPSVHQSADPWGQRLRDPSVSLGGESEYVGVYTTAGQEISAREAFRIAGAILGYRRDPPLVVDGEVVAWRLQTEIPARLQSMWNFENSPSAFWQGRYDDDD